MESIVFSSAESFIKYFMKALGHMGKYESGAKKLDNELNKIGFTNRKKFFHDYILPGAVDNLERLTARWLIISEFDKILSSSHRNAQLTAEARKELEKIKIESAEKITGITAYIKNNNPGLKQIKTPSVRNHLDFIRGAVYGYPPENIEFWINNYPNNDKLNEAREIIKQLRIKYKIDANLMRMTKSQASELLRSLNDWSAGKDNQKPVGHDSLGRMDPTGFLRWREGRED